MEVKQQLIVHRNKVDVSRVLNAYVTRPRGYKTFSMFNSSEHEILPANKQQITDKHSWFSCSEKLSVKFSMLMKMKMPTLVGIFIFISRKNFMAFSYLSAEKISCSAELRWKKKFHNLRARKGSDQSAHQLSLSESSLFSCTMLVPQGICRHKTKTLARLPG